MLEIVTEKFVDVDGEKCYKIKEVKGFIDDLPKEYRKGSPSFTNCYAGERRLFYNGIPPYSYDHYVITEGKAFSQDVWENAILPNLQKAGERLTKIRQKIKNTQKRWKGEATFCI